MSATISAIAYLDNVLKHSNFGGIHVRNLHPGEALPSSLPHNFPNPTVLPNPDWIWLVENGYKPQAMLIASPAQNVAFLMGLSAAADLPSDSTAALMLLFRTALADIYKRGYLAFWVHLEPKRAAEAKLLGFLRRMDKVAIIEHAVIAAGPTYLGGR